MERIGINAVFNAGAIKWEGSYYLVARVEANDRKSFFGLAKSSSPIDGFQFLSEPLLIDETDDPDVNVYDMRLTQHEDGWIYEFFALNVKILMPQMAIPVAPLLKQVLFERKI